MGHAPIWKAAGATAGRAASVARSTNVPGRRMRPQVIIPCSDENATECDDECVDLQSDRGHCGACGNACATAPGAATASASTSGATTITAAPAATPAPTRRPPAATGLHQRAYAEDMKNCGACGWTCPEGKRKWCGAAGMLLPRPRRGSVRNRCAPARMHPRGALLRRLPAVSPSTTGPTAAHAITPATAPRSVSNGTACPARRAASSAATRAACPEARELDAAHRLRA